MSIVKKDLQAALQKQTTALKTYTDAQTDKLAAIVNNTFEEQRSYVDKHFAQVQKEFDQANQRMQIFETKLDRALHTEVVHLETRLTRLERHVGIKK